MRSHLAALAVVCALPSCSSTGDTHTEDPLSRKIADEVHTLLLQNHDARSLYRVMQETESLLKKTLPESSVVVDVQLEKHKIPGGIGYVRILCTLDGETLTFFLSAEKIQEDGEKIMPQEIVEKLVWDMRETFRNYLDARMTLMPVSQKSKTKKQKITDFLAEETEALKKHGLVFTGNISFSGNILSVLFEDTFYGRQFDYTFMIKDDSVIAEGEE